MFLYLQPLSQRSSLKREIILAQIRIDAYLCNPDFGNKFFELLKRLVQNSNKFICSIEEPRLFKKVLNLENISNFLITTKSLILAQDER